MKIGLKKASINLKSGKTISVAKKNYSSKVLKEAGVISEQDYEMDNRATSAVSTAVKKAIIMKAPVARYDREKKVAYLEYADGRREVIE